MGANGLLTILAAAALLAAADKPAADPGVPEGPAPRKARACLHGHTTIVASVAFTADGTTLASGGCDGMVKLWDVKTGKELATLQGGGGDHVYAVAFSPDSKTLAVGRQTGPVELWDVASRKRRLVL